MAADEFGYARADFWVGDEGDFRVLAGSPENLGPTEFTVQAVPAEVLKSLQSGQYARDYLAKLAEKAERDRLQREKAGARRPAVSTAPCGCGGLGVRSTGFSRNGAGGPAEAGTTSGRLLH